MDMKKKVAAFVPIKLTSQRLPQKNILPIAGHPLYWHIVSSLLKVEEIDKTYVYCSDASFEKVVPDGAEFLQRDAKLDGDLVKGYEIYEAFINQVDADIYILAHTTSPFIKSETISSALNMVLNQDYDSALSVQKIQTFSWYQGSPINYSMDDIPRTQDLEPLYVETSGFFIFEKEVFTKHQRRIGFTPYLQEVGSIEAVDIDTKEDYEFALRIVGENE